jgi:PAS domain S-box-containing protein
MNLILDNVGRVVPHDAASIVLVEADTARVAYSRGYPPRVTSLFETYRFPLNALPGLRQMKETGLPYLVADTSTSADKEWVDVGVPGADWSRSYVGAPIRTRGRIIGFLNLDSIWPGFYTSIHAERLQTFADQAAIAVENAGLYEEVQRHTAELEARVAQRTAELQKAKVHVETILDHSVDGIILIDPDGTIQQANRAFGPMFGFSGAVEGKSLHEFVEPSERAHCEAALRTVTHQRQPRRVELTCVRADGALFDADAALALLSGIQDDDLRMICSLRDISQHKHLESELREALAKEKELNELKTSFTSIVSHEFRTPLSVILSSTDLLTKYADRMNEHRRQEKLANIARQVRRLITLMDDVLTITRSETTGFEFKPTNLDLVALSEEILDEVSIGKPGEITLDFTYHGNCEHVFGDEFLYSHILRNLATNAIKYSKSGGTVYISLSCSTAAVTLRVEDQGIGIPEDDQSRLFNPFRRASNVGQIQGTGIGLTIVKRAVDAWHGTIEFESGEGRGTTFILTLPTLDIDGRSTEI